MLLSIAGQCTLYTAYLTLIFTSPFPYRPVLFAPGAIGAVACSIATIVGAFRLARAAGLSNARAALLTVASYLPAVGIFVLLAINQYATHLLKARGVNVGLLGVTKQDLNKLIEGVCDNCGYDMSALPQGTKCPEFGWFP